MAPSISRGGASRVAGEVKVRRPGGGCRPGAGGSGPGYRPGQGRVSQPATQPTCLFALTRYHVRPFASFQIERTVSFVPAFSVEMDCESVACAVRSRSDGPAWRTPI